MVAVAWYTLGRRDITEKDMEEEIGRKRAMKASRAAWIRGGFKN
jgi:LmbE family N-acetylglucosaminyl deacetylase